MDAYIRSVLDPETDQLVQAPDMYYRRTSVFKQCGNYTISSSLSKGHVLSQIYPQHITQPATFATWVGDNGGVLLDVTNYPAGLPTFNSITGQTLATYYSWIRLVSFGIKLTYIGAELTQAGELSIGFDNVNQLVAGYNIKNNIQDGIYFCRGKSDKDFKLIWVPQDDTDFQFRTPATVNKTQFWGSITIAGTGFPVGIPVYDVTYTAILEATVLPSNLDFIPRSVSQPLDQAAAMMQLKTMLTAEPKLLCCAGGKKR